MRPIPHPHSARQVVVQRDSARRLRDILRSNIVHGAYPGAKMPSESELMRQHDASRAVVRAALQLLRNEGLVDRLQGYGTYPLDVPRIEGLVDAHGIDHAPRAGFWAEVTHLSVLSRRVVTTPDAVAALMPTAGDRVYELDYLVHFRADVMGGATNYFRFPEADAVAAQSLGTDFYEFLARCGVKVSASSLTIGASVIDEALAASTGIPGLTPLLTLEQTLHGTNGDVIDVAFFWARADRIMLNSVAAAQGTPGY
jgi:GntR family transcriptional regulator